MHRCSDTRIIPYVSTLKVKKNTFTYFIQEGLLEIFFVIGKEKETTYMPVHKDLNKQWWYIHIMEHDEAIKINNLNISQH